MANINESICIKYNNLSNFINGLYDVQSSINIINSKSNCCCLVLRSQVSVLSHIRSRGGVPELAVSVSVNELASCRRLRPGQKEPD
jgi:hypothetical protein